VSGPSGASGVSGPALSATEWVSQADAICKAGDKELDTQAEALFSGGEPSPAELEEYVGDVLVPAVQDEIDQVAALTPPEEDAADVEAFLDSAQEELDALEADPASIQAGDPFSETEPLAKDLGLQECAS
jgi:hypothetical protein